MEKSEIIAMAREYVCPGKIDAFGQIGIDLVIGKRQGPYIFDTEGKRFIDLHINGGVFNLGHRHPELIKILMSAFEELDIGNHHFASEARALLARKLAEKTPGDLHYTVFTSSGSEAVDIAIKTARWATKRRQIVSLDKSGIGKKLLQYLQSMTEKPILIGTWAAASWAVSFYLRDLHFTPPLFGINCYLNLAGRFG